MLEEIFYFADDVEEDYDVRTEEGEAEREEYPIGAFNEATRQILISKESVALLIKPKAGQEIESMLDEVLRLVYGEMMRPPGDEDSPCQLLLKQEEDEDTGETNELTGIWAPPNPCMTAACMKLFFPKVSIAYAIPEPEPTPPHYAVIFGLTKFHEALDVINRYPKDVMKYGFFTSHVPKEAELIAKTYHKLEKSDKRTFSEKLVIEVSAKKSECMFALAQLEPLYISPNTDEGERECELFFPDEFDVVKLTKEVLEELTSFTDYKFSKKTIEDVASNKPSVALLLMRRSENLMGDIDEIVLQMVYGNARKPPGDEKSPSVALMKKGDEDDKDSVLVAIGYDAFKARDVLKLSEQYPGQVMAYGFFTSEAPEEAQLIAKTMEEFEARTTPVTTEKIVIQLIKENPECFDAFNELNPSYVSFDAIVGEQDCRHFFPPGYNAPPVEVTQVKKKSRKRRKHAPAANKEADAASDANVDQLEAEHAEDDNEDQESDEEKRQESLDNDDGNVASGADKATSPIHDENVHFNCNHLLNNKNNC
ncbi:hypothetical protein NQ318_008940 [Aromia moschata]|uniref:DUF4746 domain-containing protein n=1 Tax=Aromia moschata TaxID=1265417 RepID=A0AAV8ZBL5_9CUCU|nr:hypothetical protein NQ318_008940 [Aromia moschata]